VALLFWYRNLSLGIMGNTKSQILGLKRIHQQNKSNSLQMFYIFTLYWRDIKSSPVAEVYIFGSPRNILIRNEKITEIFVINNLHFTVLKSRHSHELCLIWNICCHKPKWFKCVWPVNTGHDVGQVYSTLIVNLFKLVLIVPTNPPCI
jgi:hypothetical protein